MLSLTRLKKKQNIYANIDIYINIVLYCLHEMFCMFKRYQIHTYIDM